MSDKAKDAQDVGQVIGDALFASKGAVAVVVCMLDAEGLTRSYTAGNMVVCLGLANAIRLHVESTWRSIPDKNVNDEDEPA